MSFCDVCSLAGESDFSADAVMVAVRSLFARRQTSMNSDEELLDIDFAGQAKFSAPPASF